MFIEQNIEFQLGNMYGNDYVTLFRKAFNFAQEKHLGQKRDSGEDYITHPYAVSKILIEAKADEETIICGLLHDCLDSTDTTDKEIREKFGENICQILQGFAKLEAVKRAYFKHGEETESLGKMILAMGGDTRIAFVKLAERLHNMQTLQYRTLEKQKKTAKETIALYVPLAERLGMNIFKRQMEDLCFQYLYPEEYVAINQYIDEFCKKNEDIVDDIAQQIKKIAESHNIEARIQSRKKSGYSLFKKQKEKGLNNIFDIVAHRIIVKKVQDCYTMLGALHERWKPLDGRIKDYIAHPKPNLYMSLHTTPLYHSEKGEVPFEVQIRTEEMHNYCEYGIAAHWIYKEKGVKSIRNQVNVKSLRKELVKDSEQVVDVSEEESYISNIKKGFYSDKIFVFTPDLNVIELPKDSIPIDFAYNIHSNLGNKCVGAKINGKMVPLTTKLQTGDKVEIITSTASKGPSRDWLKIVKSGQASSKIKAYFKKEKKEENIKIGKDILEEFAKRNGYTLLKLFEDKELLAEIQEKYKLSTIDDIYAIVGYGGLSSSQVLGKFIAKLKLSEKQQKTVKQTTKKKKDNESVIIGGYSDLLKKFAKCCNPIPGDDIVGYVSRGKGVTIHRHDCPSLILLENDRIINVQWAEEAKEEWYDTGIKIVAKNTVGVLNTISNKIAENKVDITYMAIDKSNKGTETLINVGIKITSRKQLVEIINKLRAMNEVYDVYR